jgi:hypothetical protein
LYQVYQLSTQCRRGLPATRSASVVDPQPDLQSKDPPAFGFPVPALVSQSVYIYVCAPAHKARTPPPPPRYTALVQYTLYMWGHTDRLSPQIAAGGSFWRMTAVVCNCVPPRTPLYPHAIQLINQCYICSNESHREFMPAIHQESLVWFLLTFSTSPRT